jgi:hypothetical protein
MAHLNLLKRHIVFLSVRLDETGRLWRKPEQGSNRGASLASSLQLKNLAKQDEYRNYGSSLKVDCDRAIMQVE